MDSAAPTGKLVLQIFSTLAEYDRKRLLEKKHAGYLSASKWKYIGRLKGLNTEKFAKLKRAAERGLSIAETVSLTGINMSCVNGTEN